MRKTIKILRQRKGEKESFWQTFLYESEQENVTAAQALSELNQRNPLLDREGKAAAPVQWECNCLQGKCGACAMLIDGFPALACEEKLKDHKDTIELMPLQKFPVIEDLVADRRVLFEHLKEMKVWTEQKQTAAPEDQEKAFTASRCLQCGCCLEICTSYTDGRDFFGMAALVPAARIVTVGKSTAKKEQILEEYRKHFYECCDEFHACEHVCPAKLPLTDLMSYMNMEMKKAGETGGKKDVWGNQSGRKQ